MMNNQQKKNRLLILAIFGMTIIPFLIAWDLKENPGLVKGTTNSGQLIIPPIATERTDFTGFDPFSAENMGELAGHWLIVNVIPNNGCNEICLDALLKTKQLRLMLNKELPVRVVLLLFLNWQTKMVERYAVMETALQKTRRTCLLSLLRKKIR